MIKIEFSEACCGCEACEQVCPNQSISFEDDSEGFRYPKVDETTCVNCGLCEKVCPILSPYENRRPQQQVAAINPDDIIRKESSSGGIFSMLAEIVLKQGGVVFGVRFDEKWQAVFDHTESIEGLAAFRGSKYVQARVGHVFIEVKDFLQQGRVVLFSGTPCQVAALRHFLHRDYNNLLLVDIACLGVPSPKVWGKYLDEITPNAVKAINDAHFRDNKQGWKRFNFDLTYDKDEQLYNISSWYQQNHFMRLYLSDVILRPSCHNCKAKGGRSGSDLTLADFWGIKRLNPQMDDDSGTSLVLVYSDKGRSALDALHLDLWNTSFDVVLRHNPTIERNKSKHPKRNLFFARLDKEDSVVNLIDDILRESFATRIKKMPRRIAEKLYRQLKKAFGKGSFVQSSIGHNRNMLSLPEFNGQPIVRAFTFRSKLHGWKQYRMEIKIGTK